MSGLCSSALKGFAQMNGSPRECSWLAKGSIYSPKPMSQPLPLFELATGALVATLDTTGATPMLKKLAVGACQMSDATTGVTTSDD